MNKESIFVAGATGATGQWVVKLGLKRSFRIRSVVRSKQKLMAFTGDSDFLNIREAAILDLSDAELTDMLKGCDAVVSCLGHNLSWKGIYGKPRRLVTEATRRLCRAIERNKPDRPVKFILMNTAGNRNRDLKEAISWGERVVISLLRILLPPHPDNEKAADFLRQKLGADHAYIEWVAVRPDSLFDETSVSDYEVHPSPIRSALFNPGKTSRINVAHFMIDLVDNNALWKKWRGGMPVIYNKEDG